MIIMDMVLVGVGLSMDAFAASVCKGLCYDRIQWKHAFATAFSFGLFQGIMPLIGWLLGSTFAHLIEPVDHWIAFALLAMVGSKMLRDAFHGGEDEDVCAPFSIRELMVLSVATSIDALVVGISFSMTAMNIGLAALVIGVTTFVLSLAGFAIGNRFGARYERAATIFGGIALIALGAKILLEHLFG